MPLRLKKNAEEKVNHLLESLPDHFKLDGDSFQLLTWSGDALRTAIAASYHCPTDLHPLEFKECTRRAVRAAFQKIPIGRTDLEEALQNEIDVTRQQPKKLFIAWTRINYRPTRAERFTVIGRRFELLPALPVRLAKHSVEHNLATGTRWPEPAGGVLITRGRHRNATSAGYELAEGLDEFVASLNFWQNRPNDMVWPVSARAIFKLGPIFYLYSANDRRYEDSYWNNTDYDVSRWHRGADQAKRMRASLEKTRRAHLRRRKNPLYGQALSCVKLINSFWTSDDEQRGAMLIWSGYEKIFSRSAQERYNVIAKRAAKFDRDSRTREILLTTLADYRNMAAHLSDNSGMAIWQGIWSPRV